MESFPRYLKRVLNAKPSKLLISVTLVVGFASVGFRIWEIRSRADGSHLAEGRHTFHIRQMDFKNLCAQGVIGKRIEEVVPIFGSLQGSGFAGTVYGSKHWPCELVVKDGLVQGGFYHDFPFKTQSLPPNYRVTHALPYFERYPEFLREEYSGRWDGKGGYVFEKTATSR